LVASDYSQQLIVVRSICAAPALIASTVAAPLFKHDKLGAFGVTKSLHSIRDVACITQADAQQVATSFAQLLTNYTDTLADEVLSSNFTEKSSSTNYLIDSSCSSGLVGVSPAASTLCIRVLFADSVWQLETTTFDSLAAFKAGQSSQPSIPFEQLNFWHSCNSVCIFQQSRHRLTMLCTDNGPS